MTEEELRVLVRQAIARHRDETGVHTSVLPSTLLSPRHHSSHAMFVVASGADDNGPCIIEPAVACNHCGYCKSMGH